jgi:hypothetical protein
MKFAAMLLMAGCCVGLTALSGEGADAPKGDAPQGEGRGPEGRNRDRGGERGGGDRRFGGGGGVDMRGRGDPGQWGGLNIPGMIGGRGNGNVVSMASRLLNIEIEDPKAPVKLDDFPLGAERRTVLNVPVGGIDNPGGNGSGWKMESVYKLTDEQAGALETVRTEYETEQKKLDAEIKEQMKAIAEKVIELRKKYELRANDVLAGEDKASKEKIDTYATDLQTKNHEVTAEIQPLFDQNDMQQGFTMIRMMREKTSENLKEYETKLLETIPEASRERIGEVLRRQSDMRDQMGRWIGGNAGRRDAGAQGGPGGDRPQRGNRNGDPVVPPRPPETEKAQF